MKANPSTAERLHALAELYQQGQVSELMDHTLEKLLRYHWADADNRLIKRWDNTPHSRISLDFLTTSMTERQVR